MSIEKKWINRNETGHNIVVFNDNIIYRRKAKKEEVLSVENELNRGLISPDFVGLPIGYVKKIEYRKDDNILKFSYGQESVDSFEIKDQKVRKEVFNYLKDNTKVKKNYIKKPSIISRIKSPLIALIVLVGLFVYVFSLIDGMNQGYEYDIGGGRPSGAGMSGIILGLAYLGLTKNIIIFSILASIALFKIKLNLENNSEIHYLLYK